MKGFKILRFSIDFSTNFFNIFASFWGLRPPPEPTTNPCAQNFLNFSLNFSENFDKIFKKSQNFHNFSKNYKIFIDFLTFFENFRVRTNVKFLLSTMKKVTPPQTGKLLPGHPQRKILYKLLAIQYVIKLQQSIIRRNKEKRNSLYWQPSFPKRILATTIVRNKCMGWALALHSQLTNFIFQFKPGSYFCLIR